MSVFRFYLGIIAIVFFTKPISAQDSLAPQPEKEFKNTIRYNISNPLIFGYKSVIFGYERTIGTHKSFCVNLGQAALNNPSDFVSERGEVTLQKRNKDRGLHISGDFRFYLKKENKYNAPHGIYIGPYYGYNYFERNNYWTLDSKNYHGELTTKYVLAMHTVGFELGYQFVLWKRITLDMVMFGPGISFYRLSADVDATLDPEDREIIFEGLHKVLSERVPGYSLIVNGDEFTKSGYVRSATIGFRYVIHLGFRF